MDVPASKTWERGSWRSFAVSQLLPSQIRVCLARKRIPCLIDCLAVDEVDRLRFVSCADCKRWCVDPSHVAWSNMPDYVCQGMSTVSAAEHVDDDGAFPVLRRTSPRPSS